MAHLAHLWLISGSSGSSGSSLAHLAQLVHHLTPHRPTETKAATDPNVSQQSLTFALIEVGCAHSDKPLKLEVGELTSSGQP